MRIAGFALLVIGILWLIGAYTMDVSVPTISGNRVNNIGLISDRQNNLLLAGLITLIGVLLSALGKDDKKSSNYSKCPFCAEEIRVDAILCKHCRSSITSETSNKTEYTNNTQLQSIANENASDKQLQAIIDKLNKHSRS